MEWYAKLTKQEWNEAIQKLLKKKSDKNITDLLIDSVKKRTEEEFALLFSGGLDSSLLALICKKLRLKFKCYYIGTENSKDLVYAREIAKKFNLDYKERIINENDIQKIVTKVKNLVPSGFVNLDLGILFYLALDFVKEKNIIIGAGAEELFAGYARHRESKQVRKDCINDLKTIYERDLIRTKNLAKHFDKNILTPFLDKDLIIAAFSREIKKDKLILREIAKELGLGEHSERKKLAGQYGSGIDKIVKKLWFN